MKILVVGGSPTHGVPEQERFDIRLTQYLANRVEAPAVLHLAVPGTLADAVFALQQPLTPLHEYDLILLQTGDSVPSIPSLALNRPVWKRARLFFRELIRHRAQRAHLRCALALLEPHRPRVVVLTPPPGPGCFTPLLRRWQSHRLEALCRLWAFRVVNRCQRDLRYEFLFDETGGHLNRLGHHYLSLEIIGTVRWPSAKDDAEPAWL